MQIQNVPITSVKPYEKNPRFNDDAVDAVAKSIKEFGWQQPIVTDKDMTVICGHTRLKAAERLGLTEVPVIVADNLTPEQVKAYRIADNKTGEIAEWNYDLLPFEIKDLQDANFDLSLLGFDTDELDKLLNGDADKQVATGETEPDAVPEAPEVAVSVRGEVYQLGEHRLMCGDSTDAASSGTRPTPSASRRSRMRRRSNVLCGQSWKCRMDACSARPTEPDWSRSVAASHSQRRAAGKPR